jgi:hypothetical protein
MAGAADISVTVLCGPGTSRLRACIASVIAARGRFRLDVTIVAYGARAAWVRRATVALSALGVSGRVFRIDHDDTANALNHALGALRRPARLHVFVHGGAVIAPDTLSGFAALLSRHPEAVAATGVPGRDPAEAKATLREGGRLHAPLFAMRPAFLERLSASGLHVPVGLQSTHWLLARMACHDLDARQYRWDKRRIAGATEAVFDARVRRLGQAERRMRGFMELAALSALIARDGFGALPDHADTMLRNWVDDGGLVPATRGERFFLRRIIRKLSATHAWTDSALQPALVFETDG